MRQQAFPEKYTLMLRKLLPQQTASKQVSLEHGD